MLPRTATVPKSMLEVAGRPFVAWQLEALGRAGYTDVLMLIGHLGRSLREFVGDGSHFDLSVRYAEDGPTLLGTAGALRHALDQLEDAFLVTYGDSYLPFDYAAPLSDLLAHSEADGTMSVFENGDQWDSSNTSVEDELVVSYEKGAPPGRHRFIDYGAIALRRRVIAKLPAGEFVRLEQVQRELTRQRRLRAYLARERFSEIGSEAGLRELEQKLRQT